MSMSKTDSGLAMTRSVTSNIIHRQFSFLLPGQPQQKQPSCGSGAAVSSLFSIFLPLLLASFFLLLHASRRYATLITFFQQSLIILLTLRIRWATQQYAVEGKATAKARILVIQAFVFLNIKFLRVLYIYDILFYVADSLHAGRPLFLLVFGGLGVYGGFSDFFLFLQVSYFTVNVMIG